MRIIADLHNHTLVSSHALNTMTDMAKRGAELGLFAMAITDHGPEINDGAHPWYFWMLKNQPDVMEGIFVIKGIEANVTNLNGRVDSDEFNADRCVDFTIASIHGDFFSSLSRDDATELWLNVAKKETVDMIGHSEESRFAYDYDLVTRAFTENNKVVELNVNSATVRPGNEKNFRNLILACKKNETQVCVNSDAHSIYNMGRYEDVVALLDELSFPEELVVNSSKDRLLNMFKLHNYDLYERMLKYDNAFI